MPMVRKWDLRELARDLEKWEPKELARIAGVAFRLVRLAGTYRWHVHRREDEAFVVLEGKVFVDTEGGTHEVGPGEMLIVPAGLKHRSRVPEGEALVLLVEPAETVTKGE